jgi:hypothetical protein
VQQTMVEENEETGVIREVRVPLVDRDIREVWDMHLRLEESKGSMDQRSFDRSLVFFFEFWVGVYGGSWSVSINGGRVGLRLIMCFCPRSVIGC